MLINDRSGRAAAAVVLLLLVLALIAYGVYWYSQNQLPKLLSKKAQTSAAQNQPGAPGATGQPATGQPPGGGAAVRNADPAAQTPKPLTVEFAVTGMTCDDCSKAIESELIKLPGVSTVSADWKSGTAKVQYDAAKVTNEQLIAAIDKLGYKAKLKPETAQAPAATG